MPKAYYSKKIKQKINPTDTSNPDDYSKILLGLADKTIIPMYPNHQKKTMEMEAK